MHLAGVVGRDQRCGSRATCLDDRCAVEQEQGDLAPHRLGHLVPAQVAGERRHLIGDTDVGRAHAVGGSGRPARAAERSAAAAATSAAPASSSRSPRRNFGPDTFSAATILPGRVAHRRGGGDEARLHLLVGDRVAALAADRDAAGELLQAAWRSRAERPERHAAEHAPEAGVVLVEEQHLADRGAVGRRLASDPAAGLEARRRRLREQRERPRALQDREERALLERVDELPQDRPGEVEQAPVAGQAGERVDPPAEPVGEAVGIAIDEPEGGERLQRARHLALLATEQIGDARDAETAALDGRLRAEREQHLEAAANARLAIAGRDRRAHTISIIAGCSITNHRCRI